MNKTKAILIFAIISASIAKHHQYIAQVDIKTTEYDIETKCLWGSCLTFKVEFTISLWRFPIGSTNKCTATDLENSDISGIKNMMTDVNLVTVEPVTYTVLKSALPISKFQFKAMLSSWKFLADRMLKHIGRFLNGSATGSRMSPNLILEFDENNESVDMDEDQQLSMHVIASSKAQQNPSRTILYSFCSSKDLFPVIYRMDEMGRKQYSYDSDSFFFSTSKYPDYGGDTYIIVFEESLVKVKSNFELRQESEGGVVHLLRDYKFHSAFETEPEKISERLVSLPLGKNFDVNSVTDFICFGLDQKTLPYKFPMLTAQDNSQCGPGNYKVSREQTSSQLSSSYKFEFLAIPEEKLRIQNLMDYLLDDGSRTIQEYRELMEDDDEIMHNPKFDP
jgi:hypothetical protein